MKNKIKPVHFLGLTALLLGYFSYINFNPYLVNVFSILAVVVAYYAVNYREKKSIKVRRSIIIRDYTYLNGRS